MTNLNRRIFLRGLGGALVAAPFLGSVCARSSKAQQAPAPKRTILMFTHYGCITNKWFPAKLDGGPLAEDLLPTSLAPLAPFAKKLLMPRGTRTMNEWTKNNTGAGSGRGQGNDEHLNATGSLLTCQPLTPNSNDPFSFNTATKFDAMPIGPSLDHVLASQLSPGGTPLLMNVSGVLKESAQSAISFSASQTIFGGLNASQAFSALTGLFAPGAPMNGDTWAATKGKLIADLVKDDLSQLSRQDMSKADKDKLAAWLELTNSVGQLVKGLQCGQDLVVKLGASNALASGDDGDVVTRKINDTMDNADLYSAIAALTAACNANPVIVLKYPPAFLFSGLGLTTESDNLNRRLDQASSTSTCIANALDDLVTLDSYYAQKFANLVQMLDSIPEGDGGTVLDNSVAFWTMEDSDGGEHNLNNHPIIQAGSGGGYFKTGKIINLDTVSGATAVDLLGWSTSPCTPRLNTNFEGLPYNGTGTDPRFGNLPVNKYYCNIMNAMGLKADANGFPAKDGPASEVTHFGYSDKTEDFCGGAGAIPHVEIHDPGGFNELKAL